MKKAPGIDRLLDNNRAWAERVEREKPGFFAHLAQQQSPAYLWIGCADSRVPANEIVGLEPGELFVHRNVANLFSHSDLNGLSVLQFAVDVIKVKHIIVCGHYGCSGVRAALQDTRLGVTEHWIRPVRDICERHRHELDMLPSEGARVDRLCELNVMQQVRNLCRSPVLQDAWSRGQKLAVHSWVYGLEDGLVRPLGPVVAGLKSLDELGASYLMRGAF
ncbi:carbonic anhydrase [Paramagnetospirillum marisnigri]|uniref:Carbonic anhydrase 2 n=1 Tax=Paramagnetospirillum marisnigri TaxID=1285242 RepID=A0A178MNL2_9PROT|nr:carbonate dehydratase [Paramagnetospirillum marisnigri]OAN50143.1 carbonic anhydrase [Paramagnetospirillum marisnigri]